MGWQDSGGPFEGGGGMNDYAPADASERRSFIQLFVQQKKKKKRKKKDPFEDYKNAYHRAQRHLDQRITAALRLYDQQQKLERDNQARADRIRKSTDLSKEEGPTKGGAGKDTTGR